MKKIPLGITIGLMAITAAASFVVTSNYTLDKFNKKISNVNEKQEFYSKLSEIDTYIRTHYVDDIEENTLIEGMVDGYISGIGDKFASYMTAEEYAEKQASRQGIIEGLGFEYEREPGGYIRIKNVEIGGAAEEAGLLAGDIITAVNNTDVIAFEGGYDEAVSLFRCTEGTRVKLYIKRVTAEDGTNFIDYDVISRVSEHISVTGRLINKTGCIRISDVTEKTETQLKTRLEDLVSLGAENLVIDLRDLDFDDPVLFEKITDHILGRGCVNAVYKNGTSEQIAVFTEAESIKMPMCVLINGGTGNMAEYMALCLHDYAGATVIGTASMGNGRLQSPYICSDGSVVMLSVAALSTESGEDIYESGINPDIPVSLPEGTDISAMTTDEALVLDAQLLKALDILSGDPDD